MYNRRDLDDRKWHKTHKKRLFTNWNWFCIYLNHQFDAYQYVKFPQWRLVSQCVRASKLSIRSHMWIVYSHLVCPRVHIGFYFSPHSSISCQFLLCSAVRCSKCLHFLRHTHITLKMHQYGITFGSGGGGGAVGIITIQCMIYWFLARAQQQHTKAIYAARHVQLFRFGAIFNNSPTKGVVDLLIAQLFEY